MQQGQKGSWVLHWCNWKAHIVDNVDDFVPVASNPSRLTVQVVRAFLNKEDKLTHLTRVLTVPPCSCLVLYECNMQYNKLRTPDNVVKDLNEILDK